MVDEFVDRTVVVAAAVVVVGVVVVVVVVVNSVVVAAAAAIAVKKEDGRGIVAIDVVRVEEWDIAAAGTVEVEVDASLVPFV